MLGVASFFNGHSPSFARFDFVSESFCCLFHGLDVGFRPYVNGYPFYGVLKAGWLLFEESPELFGY